MGFLERVPPQNLEAERSVLGGVLLENQAMPNVMEILQEEDFYRGAHRKIYQAMIDLSERRDPVDLITLTEEVNRKGALQDVGGAVYLAALADEVPTAANILYYAKIVKEKSVLRQLIEAATEVARKGYEEPEDAVAYLDSAEQAILEISRRQQRQGFVPLRSVLQETFQSIEELYAKQGTPSGIGTGFADFDHKTAGLQRSDLVIIAGRPSMGKTALALNIARNVAVNDSVPVAIFSLEMSRAQLATRLLCAEAGVDAAKLRSGYLKKSDFPKLTKAADTLSRAPIFIDDSPSMHVREMRGKARQMKLEHQVELVVVDYLQLMQGTGRIENRVQEISEISRGPFTAQPRGGEPAGQEADAGRPARVRGDRTGCGSDRLHLPRGILLPGQARGSRQGRADHRQAAKRPDRNGSSDLPAGTHAVPRCRPRTGSIGFPGRLGFPLGEGETGEQCERAIFGQRSQSEGRFFSFPSCHSAAETRKHRK